MRILVIQPHLEPFGGGAGVCAWMLQALKDRASEAVAKMSAALDDAALRATLDDRLRARREHLAPERFVMDVRRLVAALPKPPANREPPGYDSARAAS